MRKFIHTYISSEYYNFKGNFPDENVSYLKQREKYINYLGIENYTKYIK